MNSPATTHVRLKHSAHIVHLSHARLTFRSARILFSTRLEHARFTLCSVRVFGSARAVELGKVNTPATTHVRLKHSAHIVHLSHARLTFRSARILFSTTFGSRLALVRSRAQLPPVGSGTVGVSRAERIIQDRNTQAGGAGFVGVPCRNQSGGCGKSLESDARPLTCTFDAPCPAVLINTAGVRGIRRLIAITSGPTLIP